MAPVDSCACTALKVIMAEGLSVEGVFQLFLSHESLTKVLAV